MSRAENGPQICGDQFKKNRCCGCKATKNNDQPPETVALAPHLLSLAASHYS
jgi:hypothetical protein